MAYARIQGNAVVEIIKPVDGFSIQQCFHPDLLKNIFYCPDDVQAGWVRQEDGTFVDPNATEEPEATEETTPSTDAPT